jgi:hypothetical protein
LREQQTWVGAADAASTASSVDGFVTDVRVLVPLAAASLNDVLASDAVPVEDVALVLAAHAAVDAAPARAIVAAASRAMSTTTTPEMATLATFAWARALTGGGVAAVDAPLSAFGPHAASAPSCVLVTALAAAALGPASSAVALPIVSAAAARFTGRGGDVALAALSLADVRALTFSAALLGLEHSGSGDAMALLSQVSDGKSSQEGGTSPGIDAWVSAFVRDVANAVRPSAAHAAAPAGSSVGADPGALVDESGDKGGGTRSRVRARAQRIHATLAALAPLVCAELNVFAPAQHGAVITNAPSIGRVALALPAPARIAILLDRIDGVTAAAFGSAHGPADLFGTRGVPRIFLRAVGAARARLLERLGWRVAQLQEVDLLASTEANTRASLIASRALQTN